MNDKILSKGMTGSELMQQLMSHYCHIFILWRA